MVGFDSSVKMSTPGQSAKGGQSVRTVLLVEDDPDHLQLILRSFRDAPGAPELLIAQSLAEAKDALAKHSPELVVVDLQLPDGEGTALLDWSGEKPPMMIILTAQADRETAVRLMKAGAYDYLVKSPQAFADLPHTVARSLRELDNQRECEELQQQLRKAQKLETLGSLASGVAHDFNNILTAIIGYASLLEEKMSPEDPLLADIREISKAGRYGAELTTQLLAFSRHQLLCPKPVAVNPVIEDILEILQRLLSERVKVQSQLAEDLALVLADPGQIRQVLLNLAVNARDAMPEGGLVRIETRNIELSAGKEGILAAGNYVLLSVKDSGEGMSPEQIERVFEPFYSTRKSGTGLGLAIVYGIVNQSGGHITVTSEPGAGTVFDVYLPTFVAVGEEFLADSDEPCGVERQVR